jgi:hypothetical protein
VKAQRENETDGLIRDEDTDKHPPSPSNVVIVEKELFITFRFCVSETSMKLAVVDEIDAKILFCIVNVELKEMETIDENDEDELSTFSRMTLSITSFSVTCGESFVPMKLSNDCSLISIFFIQPPTIVNVLSSATIIPSSPFTSTFSILTFINSNSPLSLTDIIECDENVNPSITFRYIKVIFPSMQWNNLNDISGFCCSFLATEH